MVSKISNFDEILEKFIKFLIGKKVIGKFIFKCVKYLVEVGLKAQNAV